MWLIVQFYEVGIMDGNLKPPGQNLYETAVCKKKEYMFDEYIILLKKK